MADARLPAEIAAGILTPDQVRLAYVVQGGWITIFIAIAVLVWKRGVRTFTAVGA